jgi:membrane-associated phospholipid phosphatase
LNTTLLRRFIAEWKIKACLGGILALVFWAGYFALERRLTIRAAVMPTSRLDDVLPLMPSAAWVYVSQFLTTPLILWLAPTRRTVLACCGGVAIMACLCFSAYFLWPTAVERAEAMTGRNIAYDLVIKLDQPRNACPSLHAGFAIFLAGCAWFTQWSRWRRIINGGVWFLTAAVLLATLLIKQHVVIDLLAGGVVGIGSYWSVRRWLVEKGGTADVNSCQNPITPPLAKETYFP